MHLESICEGVDNVERWLSDLASSPQFPRLLQHVTIKVESMRNSISRLQDDHDIAQKDSKRKVNHFFRAGAKKRLDEIRKFVVELKVEVDSLVTMLIEIQEKANEEDTTVDRFKVSSGMVPKNEGSMYFAFQSTDSDRSLLKSAATFKNAILIGDGTSVAAIQSGSGGEGNTYALQAIGNHEDTKTRFTGGVLYMSLGAESNKNGDWCFHGEISMFKHPEK